MPSLGQPTPLHLRYAEELRDSFPESVRAATREPAASVALIYALLLSDDATLRATQLQELAKRTSAAVRDHIATLRDEVAPIAARARLPLVNIALPALRNLNPQEFLEFKRTLKWLIESDSQIDVFEFVLQKIIERNLAAHFAPARPQSIQFYSMKPLVPDVEVLLSALARLSSGDEAEVAKAFASGVPCARTGDRALTLLPMQECGLARIDAALNRVALAVPQIKKNLLEASVRVVGADGVVQEREAELLRAIAETLDCPIPPFVQIK